jgi:hypothetical protein
MRRRILPSTIDFYDLVERAAAHRGVPRLELWRHVFQALVSNELPATNIDEKMNVRVAPKTFRQWLIDTIGRNVDPSRLQHIIRRLLVPESGFRRWFKQWFARMIQDTDEATSQLTSVKSLKQAPEREIHKAISAVYDEAERKQSKPPNIKEIAKPVQRKLFADGYEASGRRIQEIAGATKYRDRRRKPGRTLKAELRSSRF